MKTPRIAVSGDKGSFSEEAGLLYAQREGLKAGLLYAVEIGKVLELVSAAKAELGIFPVVNSRGGLVQTAYEAMGGHLFAFLGELWLEVHQCLLA
ncbi:MAG: prephenate dehydratase domain-containing protein, partial [Elusimicrobiota bacterium]